jgi:hypothetical protein
MQKVTLVAERPPSSTPLSKLVKQMKAARPLGDVEWKNNVWDVTGAPRRAAARSHDKKKYRLLFSNYDSETRTYSPFPQAYEEFAKAITCYRHDARAQAPPVHRVALRALRYLCSALQADGKMEPSQLRSEHFQGAENLAMNSEKATSAYRVGQKLEEISELVDRLALSAVRIAYRCTIKRQTQRAIAEKDMTDEEIDAFGDLSSKIVKGLSINGDLIRMRLLDIEVCTGFRIGELLTLSDDPIVRDEEGFGLRYWPEKGGDVCIKRVVTPAIEIVERAVAELFEICAPARQMAQWLQQNPGKVYFPPDTPEWLTFEDASRLVGLTPSGMVQAVRRWRLPVGKRDPRRPTRDVIARKDLQAALVSLRDDRLVIDAKGYKQPHHKTLVVLFKNEMKPDARPFVNLVEHIDIQKMYYFLGIKKGSESRSAFHRYDIKLPNGEYPAVSPHRFRHWLDTLYRRGGLSGPDIARLFGRKRIDMAAYDHRSTAERAEVFRQLIREDRVAGPMVDAYKGLPPELRESFLQTQVTAALVTQVGGCLHDWAQSPCALHLNCLSDCDEYIRTKGDTKEREALKTQRSDTVALLENSKREMADGAVGANNWVLHFERQLRNIDKALAVDDDLFEEVASPA